MNWTPRPHDTVLEQDGSRFYLRDKKLHRYDGPAVTHPDGRRQWWLDGEQVSEHLHERVVWANRRYNTPRRRWWQLRERRTK